MIKKSILARNRYGFGAALVEAGPLLFTCGCDGARDLKTGDIIPSLAGAAEAQCENSYGAIADLLRQANLGVDSVVRLDHFTSSQDWLPRRQAVRGRIFGKPAPLASTGVAAKMSGINMLTTAVVAAREPERKRVIVDGPKNGMENISSTVLAEPFLFVSGLRGTVDPRTRRAVPEETATAFQAQTEVCYEIMQSILNECGVTAQNIIRLDCFLRDINRADEEFEIRRKVLGEVECAVTMVGLPLGGRGEIEVTALALEPGQGKKQVYRRTNETDASVVCGGGFIFVANCNGAVRDGARLLQLADDTEKQIHNALDVLAGRLQGCGSGLDSIVRLDVYLSDIYWAGRLQDILQSRFNHNQPAVFLAGAELTGINRISFSAIAIQNSASSDEFATAT